MKNLMLTLVLMMFLASPVTAGCAWVLWVVQFTGPGGGSYEPMEGFENKANCVSALNKFPKLKVGMTATPEAPIIMGKCLPETVDPRSTKEK